jgi:hypothetical protein
MALRKAGLGLLAQKRKLLDTIAVSPGTSKTR